MIGLLTEEKSKGGLSSQNNLIGVSIDGSIGNGSGIVHKTFENPSVGEL